MGIYYWIKKLIMAREILITEKQFNQLLKEYNITDNIILGEPVAINGRQVKIPVSIDGKSYSEEEINFIIEPHNMGGTELYQPHIFISPDLQQHGFGYRIYRAFIREYGNLYSREYSVVNKTGAISKIYQRLAQEPDIDVAYDRDGQGNYLIAYLSDGQTVNEDVSETMSGIDNRMLELAKHIYDNALKAVKLGRQPIGISPEEINASQDYFKTEEPLYIIIGHNMDYQNLASYSCNDQTQENFITINPLALDKETDIIPIILHELTHMVNYLATNNKESLKSVKTIDGMVNNFFYLFNPTEMQARLSQYYHYCQINGPVSLEDNDFLVLSIYYHYLDRLKNDYSFANSIYALLRNKQGKKLISSKYFMQGGEHISPYNSLLNHYIKLFKRYYHKAEKIYKYFSEK